MTSKKETQSDKIWNLIKDLTLEVFALPGQPLDKFVTRLLISEEVVHLQLQATAILPALEEALQKVKLPDNEQWEVVPAGAYTIIQIVPK